MKEIVEILNRLNKTISTMESCTGGALVNAITNIEGASNILKFSAITYSNEYKIKMGINKKTIEKYSVYSREVAKEMSKNISDYTNSDIGIGITGKLGVCDPNNPFGDNNTIYISIYIKETNKYHTYKIHTKYDNRIDNKKMIINKIEKELLKILK